MIIFSIFSSNYTNLTDSIIMCRLFFVTVLESGAPLSCFLEEVLYKSLNVRMNESYVMAVIVS